MNKIIEKTLSIISVSIILLTIIAILWFLWELSHI